MPSWLQYLEYLPPVKRTLDAGELIWDAVVGPATQAVANEAYKVIRSFGLAPFSIGLIILSAINKSIKEMDDFHKPPLSGILHAWDPFNSMNFVTGYRTAWNPLTTAALLGDPETWDPVLWNNGGEGIIAAWNPIEVLA